MLQSKGAAPAKGEARAPTQAFITEPVKPVTIAVGDPTQKNARRAQEATLVGLAPPPPVYFSSVNTQPMALPQEQTLTRPRDDRALATMLVAGTLIAMFAIAFSALPERESAAERMPSEKAGHGAAATPAIDAPDDVAKADAPAPHAGAQAPSALATPATAERTSVKPGKAAVTRSTAARGKVFAKGAQRRRIAKPTAD